MHDGLHITEVWQRPKSSGCWEHVILGTFDGEMWRADFIMCRGTFVRLCGHPAPSCQSRHSIQAPSICGVTQKTFWFEQAECPDWRHKCRNRIWIAFQTTLPCGLDLICKNQMSCGFLLSRLLETNVDTTWISPKSALGWQFEQGLKPLSLDSEIEKQSANITSPAMFCESY